MASRPPATRVLRRYLARRNVPPLHSALARTFSSEAPKTTTTTQPLILRTDVPAPSSGHIRVLELNRRPARNAISRGMLAALAREVNDVRGQYGPNGDELNGPTTDTSRGCTRAVVLASAVDETFCAGADLKERREMSKEETDRFLFTLRETLKTLAELQIPTISAISSLALGGGLELALATTFRVLTSTASVGLPETRLGIIPGAGGTYRLPALVGVGRARDMVLTGRRVGAGEAYFMGIADRLVEVLPDEENGSKEGETEGGREDEAEKGRRLLAKARKIALNEAMRLAQEICEGAPTAIRAGLKAVEYAREEVEGQMYERVVGTKDRNEALAAFREKRKPVFTGR